MRNFKNNFRRNRYKNHSDRNNHKNENGKIINDLQNGSNFIRKNAVILKKLGRINNIFFKDQKKSSATLVISGELFKLYFDQSVDLNLIKENLLKRKTKFQEDLNIISQKLSNKAFVDKAPKNIVDQEKTNYTRIKNDIQKIQLTIESL